MLRLDALVEEEKKFRKKPQKREKNFSLISACPVQEVVASRKIYGTVDGVTLEAFIVKKNSLSVLEGCMCSDGQC